MKTHNAILENQELEKALRAETQRRRELCDHFQGESEAVAVENSIFFHPALLPELLFPAGRSREDLDHSSQRSEVSSDYD